ncbi:MAG: hypothetical protein IT235_06230, partial [Bacteroidia bacterium]|nr:hypothetical protein [Bacteroidia bacterium]
MKNVASFILTIFVLFIACKKDNEGDKNTQGISTSPPPQLVFKFKFDSTQIRLDNLGQPSIIPAGHSAQSPVFNKMSTHYIELTPTALTAVGSGTVLYRAAETSIGGSLAIDFDSSTAVNEGQVCYSIPLSKVTPGTYSYLRVSLAYQNYNIKAMVSGYAITGTLASFIGFNTYI